MTDENQNLEEKINNIENETNKINKKISVHQENQEQLIMLVKIVQRSGVDVEKLSDKWNDEVDMENNDGVIKLSDNNISSVCDSNDLSAKIDPASFIPINIEEPHINKKVFNGIPKLNFDIFKGEEVENKNKNKKKFINHSK